MRKFQIDIQGKGAVEGLLAEEEFSLNIGSRYASNPWRGAEAYHFYLMSQRFYYQGMHYPAFRAVWMEIMFFQ
jgi:hypothetical protein